MHIHLLKDEFAKQLEGDYKTRKKIARLLGVHPLTVYRWAQENHPNLTIWTVLDFLEKEHFIKKKLLLQKVEIED